MGAIHGAHVVPPTCEAKLESQWTRTGTGSYGESCVSVGIRKWQLPLGELPIPSSQQPRIPDLGGASFLVSGKGRTVLREQNRGTSRPRRDACASWRSTEPHAKWPVLGRSPTCDLPCSSCGSTWHVEGAPLADSHSSTNEWEAVISSSQVPGWGYVAACSPVPHTTMQEGFLVVYRKTWVGQSATGSPASALLPVAPSAVPMASQRFADTITVMKSKYNQNSMYNTVLSMCVSLNPCLPLHPHVN